MVKRPINFNNPSSISFNDLLKLCSHYFGEQRIVGSHHIYKTPWHGDPRVNLQRDGMMAKPYQVIQVRNALEKMENSHEV
jgi:hypothetical protein